jgi:biopolymer transport protein ExbB
MMIKKPFWRYRLLSIVDEFLLFLFFVLKNYSIFIPIKTNFKINNTMKRFFTILAITGMLFFGATQFSYAQEEATSTEQVAATDDAASQGGFRQELKQRMIEGGPGWMGVIMLTLIFGLAISIERIIYLNLSTTKTNKLVADVENAIDSGGIEAAKELCRNTKGPVASIFYQGLDRMDEGIDNVEKAVVGYGGVQMGLLEKNISWISLFIALAPMLGFLGTVVGMVQAFDAIEKTGVMSPATVAGGIKVALLTTIFGLIVAIILQVFYNYIISKIDSIVNNMEDASIKLIDILIRKK